MQSKITNPSDINKPIMGALDRDQIDKVTQIYDEYDYQLTPKKIIIRVVVILFISLVTISVLYCGLFVLDFGKIPTGYISVNEVNITPDNILSFQLKCNEYYLTDSLNIRITENDGVMYITVKQPIIPKKISNKEIRTDLLYKKYEIPVGGSAVYYGDEKSNDKFLIWRR